MHSLVLSAAIYMYLWGSLGDRWGWRFFSKTEMLDKRDKTCCLTSMEQKSIDGNVKGTSYRNCKFFSTYRCWVCMYLVCASEQIGGVNGLARYWPF